MNNSRKNISLTIINFKSCKLEERPYRTKIDGKISTEDLTIVDMIIEDQLDEMNKENRMSLWDISATTTQQQSPY